MARVIPPRSRLIRPRRLRKPASFVLDPTHPLSRGLVSYWPLGDTLAGVTADASQYGKHGAINVPASAPVLVPSHHGGRAFNTNGSTPYVSASQPPAVTYPLSFCCWAKATAAPSAGQVMVMVCLANQTALEEFWIDFSTNGGQRQFRTVVQTATGLRTLAVGFNDTEWHHFVGVFLDSSTHALYIDGIAQSGTYSTTGTGTPTPSGVATAFVGALVYNTSNLYGNYNGSLEGARIYNRALSPAEAALLYAEPYAGLYDTAYEIGFPSFNTETGTAVLGFSGISFVGTGTDKHTGTGTLAFNGVSFVGTGTRAGAGTGNLAFSGISFVGVGGRKETGIGNLAFRGISFVGAGAVTHVKGTGILAFGGIRITASGFDAGVPGGLRQFWVC